MDPFRATTPPPRVAQQAALESPDPLALAPSSSTLFPPSVVTPRKRRSGVHAESPALKRVQSNSAFITPHKSLSPLTPQTSITTTATTTTSKSSKKLQPYIEVPPLPKSWFTPSRSSTQKSVTSLSKKMQGKMKVDDTPDDLGGYGSVDDDDDSPRRYWNSSVKSSARRTGDRDDRGMSYAGDNTQRLI
jgi:cohesin loading factor subunit SCC2